MSKPYDGECTTRGKHCPLMKIALEQTSKLMPTKRTAGLDAGVSLGFGKSTTSTPIVVYRTHGTRGTTIRFDFCPFCGSRIAGSP